MIEVTKDTFEQEVLKSDKIVLVDFWAEWCGPCKSLSPKIDAASQDPKYSAIKMVSIDVDSNKEIADSYMVRGLPTIMFFKDGIPLTTKVGNMTATQLHGILDKMIAE